jgi:hypothetical protein
VADWSGKTYAALGIAFEEKLLQNMIQQHDRNANLLITTPLKLDTWNMLKNGDVDLTWIFLPIEGTELFIKKYLSLFFPRKIWVCLTRLALSSKPVAIWLRQIRMPLCNF